VNNSRLLRVENVSPPGFEPATYRPRSRHATWYLASFSVSGGNKFQCHKFMDFETVWSTTTSTLPSGTKAIFNTRPRTAVLCGRVGRHYRMCLCQSIISCSVYSEPLVHQRLCYFSLPAKPTRPCQRHEKISGPQQLSILPMS